MDFSPFVAGLDVSLKDPTADLGFKIIHAPDPVTLKTQIETWAASLADERLAFMYDFRGCNAGGVYEFQATLGTEPDTPSELWTNNWNWEVWADSSAIGLQAQIDRWLAAIRADGTIIEPILMAMINAGAGDGTQFTTVLAWIDFPQTVALEEALAVTMARKSRTRAAARTSTRAKAAEAAKAAKAAPEAKGKNK